MLPPRHRLRKQKDFASVYEECYGEPFKVQQKTEEEKKEIGEKSENSTVDNSGDTILN